MAHTGSYATRTRLPVPSGIAEATCSTTTPAAATGSRREVSPTQSSGTRPLRSAEAVLARTTASSSPNSRRRSAWPTSTCVTPSSASSAPDTSPVKAPASSVARSCAPTWRRVVPAAERAAGITTNEGSTTSSVAPDATSGWRAARDANAAQYACARAGPKYIFRLIATVLIGCSRGPRSDVRRLERLQLGDVGLRVRRGVERVGQPLGREPPGELQADDALAHGEHLAVVGQDRTLHAERVVRDRGSDARHLVGRDRDADTGAAEQDRAVGLTVRDARRGLDGHARVRLGAPVVRVHAEVGEDGDARVRPQIRGDGVLVVDAGAVAADEDPELVGHEGSFDVCGRLVSQGAEVACRGVRTGASAPMTAASEVAPGSGEPRLLAPRTRERPIR